MGGSRWLEKEVTYLKENYNVVAIKEIAIHLKRSENTIRIKAKSLGITQSKNAPYTGDENSYILNNIGKKSLIEIAHDIGRTISAVRKKAILLKQIEITKSNKTYEFDSSISFYEDGLASQYRDMLAKMQVGESFEYPAKERQTLANQIQLFHTRIYRTKMVDETTRRVWRLV